MTVTYTLRTPVEHAGTTYQELTFREATTGDMIVADKFDGPNGKLIATFAAMSDVPLPAFKKVSMRDFNKIVLAVADLMGEDEAADGAA
ncbi:phage tail assembly protein [Shinella sp. DD12]|uniref:phage tail assembly protein n=1 Tax=Shinella sp. DD12 TaxID=1410620 RepID=UPI000437980A|nr:phage tail assembly protein [Shinella sp. DD12]EYR81862.1 Mu-like prophage FluMu protein gp41 [Shinella sp. DD12]